VKRGGGTGVHDYVLLPRAALSHRAQGKKKGKRDRENWIPKCKRRDYDVETTHLAEDAHIRKGQGWRPKKKDPVSE